jgi:hypothetical protein
MLVELYILYQVIGVGFFVGAFFAKQEILWAISMVLSGFLMVTSYSILHNGIQYSYPMLMALNLIFFLLSILYGFHDLFDKYGKKLMLFKRFQ